MRIGIHITPSSKADNAIDDLVAQTRTRLVDSGVTSSDEIRHLGQPVAAFSETMSLFETMS